MRLEVVGCHGTVSTTDISIDKGSVELSGRTSWGGSWGKRE